jgi:hypothetical protein
MDTITPSASEETGGSGANPRARFHELAEQLTDDQAEALEMFLESVLEASCADC